MIPRQIADPFGSITVHAAEREEDLTPEESCRRARRRAAEEAGAARALAERDETCEQIGSLAGGIGGASAGGSAGAAIGTAIGLAGGPVTVAVGLGVVAGGFLGGYVGSNLGRMIDEGLAADRGRREAGEEFDRLEAERQALLADALLQEFPTAIETYRQPPRPLPPRLPIPRRPGEPNWRAIGRHHFSGCNVDNAIWANYLPPERRLYGNSRIFTDLPQPRADLNDMQRARLEEIEQQINWIMTAPPSENPQRSIFGIRVKKGVLGGFKIAGGTSFIGVGLQTVAKVAQSSSYGKAATLVLYGIAVASTCFGAADVAEGSQDVHSAFAADDAHVAQPSHNIYRDGLFGGNQFAYSFVEMLLPFGASAAFARRETRSIRSLQQIAAAEEPTVASRGERASLPGLAAEISAKYRTRIDDKVTTISRAAIDNEATITSFLDRQHRTVVTNQDVTVYRLFGGRADINKGNFVTTVSSSSRIEAKINLALLPEWKNSRAYQAEIVIPRGTRLQIGKIAPQEIAETGTILEGGLDQVLLPEGWPSDWIKSVTKLKP